jgi:hypothetical protein
MNRKRIVIGIGLFAAGIALVTAVRHCRRLMSERAGAGAGSSCVPESCRPCPTAPRPDEEQDRASSALAA